MLNKGEGILEYGRGKDLTNAEGGDSIAFINC